MQITDYRKLRFNNINTPQFKHLLLLIYWPIYGLTFHFLERGLTLDYTPIECSLDAKIPFCEYFIVPFLLWFGYLVGIHLYTLLFDIPAFKKLMYFIMIPYTVTTVVYIVYPNMQLLRVTEFPRDNIFTDIVRNFYEFDTNTNVCPSLHVIGSFAVLFTSWSCKGFNTLPWRIANIILTCAISISTVFLKQHSIIDVFAGLILCAAALPFAYILPDIIAKKKAAAQITAENETISAAKS